jgi:Ca2+-binding EF-hand superfamily protein
MTMHPIRNALLLASLVAVAPLAFAQDDNGDPKVDFKALDNSNDGYITRDELPADHFLLGRFVELDENRDERLSPDEVAKMD